MAISINKKKSLVKSPEISTKNSEMKDLCISLAKADSEQEVIEILTNAGYWNKNSDWVDFGQNPNNFSTIGNQQSSPDTALVEKLINSVDAVLMRECLRRNIKPDSEKAPQSIVEAMKMFFGVSDGKLSSIDRGPRAKLAENICLVATGQKSNPSYSIVDLGEGQSPKRIPDTFLSLNKSNKLKIPFVQGKFNMGGTGALQFGSKQHNLQLIISRRDPQITSKEDETSSKWGFTVIRREDPSKGMRSSSFRYLAPQNKILMFDSPDLPLLPGEYPNAYENNLEFGSFIKLYEYQMPKGLKSLVKFDLFYRLSLLLTNVALPIKLYERRVGYKDDKNTYHVIVSGLSVRLDEDKSENLEANFPSSSVMKIMGQEMLLKVYAFKKGKREHYSKSDGVIFIVNGQAHGFLSQSFFERKSVGMSYLADSILVLIDCSKFDGRTREDLFMNSRDRLRDGVEIRSEIESQLQELLKNHPGLRALREKRRREEIENKLQDSKPLAEVIEKIIKKSPTLSKLFLQGIKITNPFNLVETSVNTKFVGKKFPTFFKITKQYTKENQKHCPINRRFRIQFETDVENEYFDRDRDAGEYTVEYEGNVVEDSVFNLWNGMGTLTIKLPENTKVNDSLLFKASVIDNSHTEPFINEFYIKVDELEENHGGNGGTRKRPPNGDDHKEKRQMPSSLDLPNIIELKKVDSIWSSHFLEEVDVLSVKDAGEGGYDFYLNMDNVHLLTEIKGNTTIDPRLLEGRYKFGMVLIGISLLQHFEKGEKENESDTSHFKEISQLCKAISPILLPMISSLGDLEIDS